jgi:nucleoid DNA-binding protein
MKNTELLDAVASTAGMTIGDASDPLASLTRVVASTARRNEVATSLLGKIHTERRAARIGRNRRTVRCSRQRRIDPENS